MTKKLAVALILLALVSLSAYFAAGRIGSDPSHLEVVATLSFEKRPLSVTVNEAENKVYIGDETGFSVVDGDTDQVIDHVPVDLEVRVVAVNPTTNNIFVSGSGAGPAVTHVLDGTTYSVVGEIPERLYEPHEIAINPTTNLVYMVDWSVVMDVPDYVRVYDGSDLSLVASIEIPGSREHPYIERVGVAVNPVTNLLYATWSGDGTLHVINGTTNEIEKTVVPSSFSRTVLVNPTTGYVYTGSVALDGASLEQMVELRGEIKAINPHDNLVILEANYDELYVLGGNDHEMFVRVPLEWWIDDIAISVVGSKMYVVHEYDQKISVVAELSGPHTHVVINEVELNPEGEDRGGEWVELYNPTSNPVDIGGWRLSNNRYGTRFISSGTVIDASGYYMFTPSGTTEWLDNTWESVTLEDTGGVVIDMTPFKTDLEDDALTWQRSPAGTDVWVLEQSTPVLKPAEFEVTDLSITPAEVEVGETIRISVNIANVGEQEGPYAVELRIDGLTVDTKTGALAGGEAITVTFELTKDEPGTYHVEIAGLTGTFTVQEPTPVPKPAEFEVTDLSITPTLAEVDQTITISVKVANVGEETGSYAVELEEVGMTVDTRTVTLAGGETTTVTFTLAKDEPGTYSIEVDGLTGTFTVREPKPAEFEVTDLTISPAEAEVGETVTISVTVTNVGEQSGSYTVELREAALTVDTRTLTLAGGATTTVTFSLARGEAGTYDIEVAGLTGIFTVQEKTTPPPSEPDTGMLALIMVAIALSATVMIVIVYRRRRARAP